MKPFYIPFEFVLDVKQFAGKNGIELIHGFNIPAAPPRQMIRFPLDPFLQLCSALESRMDGVPVLLHAGYQAEVKNYGTAPQALSVQPNIQGMIELGIYFVGEVTNAIKTRLEVLPDQACATWEIPPEIPEEGRAQLTEINLGLFMRGAGNAVGQALPLVQVRLAHAPRGPVDAYETFFGAPVTFEASRTEVIIAPETLLHPTVYPSPELAELAEKEVQNYIDHAEDATRLGDWISALLNFAETSEGWALEGVATSLQIPERTLQHRLKRERTTFKHIVESVRKERSLRLLQEGIGISRVAALLGYAEPRSFFRAFHRWYDTTPQSWKLLDSTNLDRNQAE